MLLPIWIYFQNIGVQHIYLILRYSFFDLICNNEYLSCPFKDLSILQKVSNAAQNVKLHKSLTFNARKFMCTDHILI